MNVEIDSTGTARQIAWVKQAIAGCTYPLDTLAVTVRVTWASPTPCGLAHSYMCTTPFTDGSFTITIEPWADDPNNVNNRGLPNPAADIQTFYMQSFVHELGHVIHRTLINSDELRTQAAALFWTPNVNAGGGRRSGQLQDYSPDETTGIGWVCSVVEAIAECVKCTWYPGRLIYMNRTNWRIDAQEWPALMSLLLPHPSSPATLQFDVNWRGTDWHGLFNPLVTDFAGAVTLPGLSGSELAAYDIHTES